MGLKTEETRKKLAYKCKRGQGKQETWEIVSQKNDLMKWKTESQITENQKHEI